MGARVDACLQLGVRDLLALGWLPEGCICGPQGLCQISTASAPRETARRLDLLSISLQTFTSTVLPAKPCPACPAFSGWRAWPQLLPCRAPCERSPRH